MQWIKNLIPLIIHLVQGSSRGTIPERGEQIAMKNKIRMCGLISVVLNTVYNPR